MAITETYVSVAGAGAHDGSSEANAWTLAEAIAGITVGPTRANIKAGSYSQGAATLANGGASTPIIWRGYNSTIGDLDTQGRSSDGTLNVTNFPAVTITGTVVIGSSNVLQNIDFTGALSSHLLGGSTNDRWTTLRCKITNSQNNASARCLQGDNSCALIGSDLYCSGAAHTSLFDADALTYLYDTRFRTTSSSTCAQFEDGIVDRCLFWGNSSSVGLAIITALGTSPSAVLNSTFYGIGTGITTPNNTPSGPLHLIGNHVTDCSKWIDNLHSATAAITLVEMHTRIRDVTTPRTGVEQAVLFNEITTDTGGASTDYTDAGNGNFLLISGAPGRATGIPVNLDIGWQQHADPAGGGGARGSLLRGLVG